MSDSASFQSRDNSLLRSRQDNKFPFNLPVEQYDKFSLINPTQNEEFVIAPVHIYELFKGLAIDRINLASKQIILEMDLTVEFWWECRTYFFSQIPEFVFKEQDKFAERSKIVSSLDPFFKPRHEKLMANYKSTFTKERKELEEFAAKIKNGTNALDYLLLKEEKKFPQKQTKISSEPVKKETNSKDLKPQLKLKKPMTTLKNGNIYKGEWVGDQPDGEGEMTFKNGTRYIGSFRNGKM